MVNRTNSRAHIVARQLGLKKKIKQALKREKMRDQVDEQEARSRATHACGEDSVKDKKQGAEIIKTQEGVVRNTEKTHHWKEGGGGDSMNQTEIKRK